MSLPAPPMVDMLLPAMFLHMSLPAPLLVVLLLTALDMCLPGPPMVDMLLPAMFMDMSLPAAFDSTIYAALAASAARRATLVAAAPVASNIPHAPRLLQAHEPRFDQRPWLRPQPFRA